MTTYNDVMQRINSDIKTAAQTNTEKAKDVKVVDKDRAEQQNIANILNQLDLETRRQGGLYN